MKCNAAEVSENAKQKFNPHTKNQDRFIPIQFGFR